MSNYPMHSSLQSTLASWISRYSKESHPGNPQLQRDEAFRSASLAAMTLMFVARGVGVRLKQSHAITRKLSVVHGRLAFSRRDPLS